MYVHNLDPVIFSLGPLALRWYGLVYAVGFLLGYWLLQRAAKKKLLKMSLAQVDNYVFWLIIGSMLGSRIIYALVYNPLYYLSSPLKIFAVWEGGLSFHGGLIGAVLVTYYFMKKTGVRAYTITDILVFPLALAAAVGRITNFVNGELPGRIADSARISWCVIFPRVDEQCRHPSQLYAALKNFVVFFVLLFMQQSKALKNQFKEGTLTWMFILLYGLGRFIVDFWRAPDSTDTMFLGVLLGQWLSLIMILLSAWFIYKEKLYTLKT